MKVLVVGAGGQGAPCTSILASDEDVSAIVLGDIDLDLADRVKDRICSDKITTRKLDAGKVEEIESAARGVDVVINLTLMWFNANIMKAAVKSGAHYVDTALDEPVWGQLLKGEPLYLDEEFREAGLTALIGCGASPGITDILAKYACDKLDRVDRIRIRLGERDLEEQVVSGWDPGWAPEIALTDYAAPVAVFEGGQFIEYPPFSGAEEYPFPEPVGPVIVTRHSHEEPLLMGRFIGKGLRNCEFKYLLDPIAGALVKMGFASKEPINLGGIKIAPLDLISAMVPRPVSSFLEESEDSVQLPIPRVWAIVVEVEGVKSEENTAYRLVVAESPSAEQRLKTFKRLGTVQIEIALPAAIGAKLCVRGVSRGVIAPECLDPVRFLKSMAEMGVPLAFKEERIREIS